jgi:LPXTG-motif cell wall-anchored protein/uncharacterized repeat protein (TIGR01451 family)
VRAVRSLCKHRGVTRRLPVLVACGATALATVLSVATAPTPAAAQTAPTPAPNPTMPDSCGTNVTLVLDASGSIQSSDAVSTVRNAGEAFLDALADTGSFARVTQFATLTQQLAPQTEVTTASLQSGGVFRQAIDGYYNPQPPRPSGVTIHRYDGSGDPASASNWTESNSSIQYTNWDASLDQAGAVQIRPTQLVVYVTDGDPTAYNFDQAGDPFPADDVGMNTDKDQAAAVTINRAIEEANQIKTGGTRMLAVGVGSAVTGNQASIDRLVQIAGPQTVTDQTIGTITSINQVDVALVKDFDKLAQFLRAVVSQLCSPSLTIRKLAQTSDDADYVPAAGWQFTTTPTVAGGTFQWILPDSDAAQRVRCGNPTNPDDQAPRTCPTNASGLANFQWEPDPSTAASSAAIVETVQPDYTAGRPGADNDWTCKFKDITGAVTTESGELTNNGFTLDVDPQDIITCEVYNSFDYAPDIDVVKVDDPIQVRGDLAPPANTVTSTFTVTNPGNTPLDSVTVTDTRCTPLYQSGDTNGDGRLDTDETWIYTCTRNLTTTPGDDPVVIPNTVVATGTAPDNQTVIATDEAEVTVYAPDISITKSADPAEIPVGVDTPVTYTYEVENTGNMTLTDVTVTDAGGTATCAPVTPASVATLAPDATATFTCTTTHNPADATVTFEDTDTVTGDPIFPDGTAAPPAVTDSDDAVVTATDPEITLDKTADPTLVVAGADVTYTYVVNNSGELPLVIPGQPATRDGWVVDDIGPTGTCGPTVYQGGDEENDFVLAPGEVWTYTCTTTLSGDQNTVVNTASVTGQPQPGGPTVTDRDPAEVEVVTASMDVEKTSVRPVVLDPDAPAIAGPDVPLRAPAVYDILVSNTGTTVIRDVAVQDTFPLQGGDTCTVTPVVTGGGTNAGDADSNGNLDPGEVWQYECVMSPTVGEPPNRFLTKADADVPPGNQPAAPSPVTDTVTASGEAFETPDGQPIGPIELETPAVTAQVEVISPNVTLAKTPCAAGDGGALDCRDDLLVRPDSDVTYRYLVSTTGDSPIRPLTGVDDTCAPVEYVTGDANGDGLINPGPPAEAWEYRCTTTVGTSDVTNTAVIGVIGPLGNGYLASATAAVRVFDPAISLAKTVSQHLVPAGTTVTYGFEVTNTGTIGIPADLVLADVRLGDVSRPSNPGCARPAFVGGDANGDGVLQTDEVWTYRCSGVIDDPTVDLATVVGTDVQGGLVADFDAAFVQPFHPAITVTKTASPTTLPPSGGAVTYTYEVRNTGDVPLADVASRITDDTCKPVTYVSGDLDGDGLLDTPNSIFEDAADETWIFTCTTTLTTTTTNTVIVPGTPVDPGGTPLCAAPNAADLARSTTPCDAAASGSATVTVTPGKLPATGNSGSRQTMVLGALLILGGLGLLALRRRRPTR